MKSQALHYLLEEGRLQVVQFHRFEQNYAEVLSADGYRFHRPAPEPANVDVTEIDNLDKIAAKPKGEDEPDFADAIFTLRCYLQGRPSVKLFDWPPKGRSWYGQ